MMEKRGVFWVLFRLLATLILMALSSFLPAAAPAGHHPRHPLDRHGKKKKKKQNTSPAPPLPPTRVSPPHSSSASSSWEQLKGLLSCRSAEASQVHDSSSVAARLSRAACWSSICSLRDMVHGNTRVVHRYDTDFSSSDAGSISQHETAPLALAAHSAAIRHHPPLVSLGCGGGYARGGMPLSRLSGCYECHAVSIEHPSRRYPRPGATLCACPECGEVFTKSESLELHQITRHAVSELGPEDSGRSIVEIIFKSSWLKKDRPICKIERILKVHNAPRTVARFEDYRAAVKSRAIPHIASSSSSAAAAAAVRHHHPSRCGADGNELLRFHCASLSCALGVRGSTSLCSNSSNIASLCSAATAAVLDCGVCTIIRHGFSREHHPYGVRTSASSGLAHDCGPRAVASAAEDGVGERMAMLVCRVIAGRVRRPIDVPASEEAYDSVAVGDSGGAHGNLEELLVANPRAILPCFVVIYRAID